LNIERNKGKVKKMENALLLLLGALLAILGGFCNQHNQSRLNQKKEDRELLYQAEEILIEMQPYLKEVMTHRSKELNELSKKLLYVVMRIKTKGYLDLALKLVEFAKMKTKKEKDEAIYLIKEIATINKSALDKYHRKRDELYNKAWEQLKNIVKKDKSQKLEKR